jgi:hypothetical protein
MRVRLGEEIQALLRSIAQRGQFSLRRKTLVLKANPSILGWPLYTLCEVPL